MKIKRYTAESMRAALALVRAEQGADAVILSSRRLEEGVEVIAAVDYDESLITDANLSRTAPAARPARRIEVAAPPPEERAIAGMERELQNLRRLLESELATLTWSERRLREPLQVRVLEELSALDIAPDVARALAAETPRPAAGLQDPSRIPLALLAKHMPLVGDLGRFDAGVVALVGPTGVGKTTTIAKLAARWSLRHGADGLALVSTDSYRIGARAQLETYARIFGAQLHAADDGAALKRVLGRLRAKKLVLIDTAGVGPRDSRLAEQQAALREGAPGAATLLVLPAHGEGQALEEITAAFVPAAPCACVLTKVDEAASLGAAISTVVRHKLPIAFLCNGQRVPEDLHSAHQRRVWLLQPSQQASAHAAPGREESYLERHFAREERARA